MQNELIAYVAQNKTYDPNKVMEILLRVSRNEAIIFLSWNDPNGVYLDLDTSKQGLEPLTEVAAKLLCFKQLMESNQTPVNKKQAKSEDLLTAICKKVIAFEDYSAEVLTACALLDIEN